MFIKNGVELLVGGYEIYVECERLSIFEVLNLRELDMAGLNHEKGFSSSSFYDSRKYRCTTFLHT